MEIRSPKMSELNYNDAIDPTATAQFGAISPDITGDINLRARGINQEEVAAVEALPAGSALLIVLKGPNVGARFLLDADTTTVGRRPRADIFIDDVTVSRRHAEFLRTEGGFLVRDMGSINGTYVNRERVEARNINDGDEVQIGKFRLTFHASVAQG